MGLLKTIFTILAVIALAVVGLGAYLYFTDYAAQAKVTERGSDYVLVTPDLFFLKGFAQKVALDSTTAQFICVGYHVEFRVNSHAVKVTDTNGTIVYAKDASGKETKNMGAAVRCF